MEENDLLLTTEESEPQVISVTTDKIINIESNKAFPAQGQSNEQMNHALMYGRDLSDQHPITAITGLRHELDEVESLQVVYSDKKQQADYYLWHDENPLGEYREGLFVSMHQKAEHDTLHSVVCCVEVCNGDHDVFGVTVAEAGFVGGNAYIEVEKQYENGATFTHKQMINNDYKYALVVNSGLVAVRCETTVAVGDYVVPNVRGEAKKSDGNYGYLVTALSDISGVQHAIISLSVPSTLAKATADNVEDLNERMTSAEYNIVSVTNVANSAYALAQSTKDKVEADIEHMEGQITDTVGKVDGIEGIVGDLSNTVTNANITAAQAKAIAEGAVSSAEAIRSEAVATANEASVNVKNLMKDLEPITTWTDPESGNTGASYFTRYIDNEFLETKAEIEAANGDLDTAFSSIEQNAKRVQSLVQKIDKYTVGEYSQTYGLTLEQAVILLESNENTQYIYVPTVNTNEETYNSDCVGFTKGYYYTWDVEKWKPSISNAVTFSSVYIMGTENTPYWVVTDGDVTAEDGTIYDFGGLYLWENGAWTKVASISDNILSRAVSNIRQTANEIAAEVVNTRGDVAALNIRIENNESTVTTLASHVIGDYVAVETWDEDGKDLNKIYLATDTNLYWYYDEEKGWTSTDKSYEAGLEGTMATIEQKANENGSSIGLVVSKNEDGTNKVNTASITAAINEDGDNSVGINADRIIMTGTTTFLVPDDLGENGATTIHGSRIQTGTLNANQIIVTGKDNTTTVDKVLSTTVTKVEIWYATSSSVDIKPSDDDWSITEPARTPGVIVWQKTKYTYGDGSSSEKITCDGTSPIEVRITSSAGTIYINNNIKTTLTATVHQANVDITNQFSDEAFLWEKYDADGVRDLEWSHLGQTITVNNLDVYKKAMFNCVVDLTKKV